MARIVLIVASPFLDRRGPRSQVAGFFRGPSDELRQTLPTDELVCREASWRACGPIAQACGVVRAATIADRAGVLPARVAFRRLMRGLDGRARCRDRVRGRCRRDPSRRSRWIARFESTAHAPALLREKFCSRLPNEELWATGRVARNSERYQRSRPPCEPGLQRTKDELSERLSSQD